MWPRAGRWLRDCIPQLVTPLCLSLDQTSQSLKSVSDSQAAVSLVLRPRAARRVVANSPRAGDIQWRPNYPARSSPRSRGWFIRRGITRTIRDSALREINAAATTARTPPSSRPGAPVVGLPSVRSATVGARWRGCARGGHSWISLAARATHTRDLALRVTNIAFALPHEPRVGRTGRETASRGNHHPEW
jgi:hypothetical protein